MADNSTDQPLAPKTITDRIDELAVGETVSVNNRHTEYEVVDTETYSVIVEGPDGHRLTLSQNLQSGGWNISEEIRHIEVVSESQGD